MSFSKNQQELPLVALLVQEKQHFLPKRLFTTIWGKKVFISKK
jgi:hypothetical protein